MNDGYLQIQKDGNFERPDCEQYTSTTTTAGTALYTLPTNFQKFDSVFCDGLQLNPTTKTKTLRMGTSTSTPYLYYVFGSQYGLYPTPNTTNTIELVYYRRLPEMTSVVNSGLNEDFDSAICAWAAYKAFNSVEKTQKAMAMMSDYQATLNTLLSKYMYDDVNISFGLQRSGSVYRDNVI